MALCHCQIKGCTVWWRGRGRWALMDWKGMCFSSKLLSVNKDSLLLPLDSMAACWIPPYSPKFRGGEVTPMLPSPSWPLHLDFSFLWLHKYLATKPGLQESYSTFGFRHLGVKHKHKDIASHCYLLQNPSNHSVCVKKQPKGIVFLKMWFHLGEKIYVLVQ